MAKTVYINQPSLSPIQFLAFRSFIAMMLNVLHLGWDLKKVMIDSVERS